MANQNFIYEVQVDQSPKEVFDAVNNVRGWWSDGVEGGTENLNDEFVYRHKDMHYSRQRLVEVVPNKKVVWLVTESNLSFLTGKKDEWNGTQISFEISKEGKKTKLRFTHLGLIPGIECFSACSSGWSYYLKGSLLKLITVGKGEPDRVGEKVDEK